MELVAYNIIGPGPSSRESLNSVFLLKSIASPSTNRIIRVMFIAHASSGVCSLRDSNSTGHAMQGLLPLLMMSLLPQAARLTVGLLSSAEDPLCVSRMAKSRHEFDGLLLSGMALLPAL